VDLNREKLKSLEKAEFYKRMLDRLAYVSLFADVSIAVATLVSLQAYSSNISYIIRWLNYGLTLIVIMTVVVFVIFVFASNYHKRIIRLIQGTGHYAVSSMKMKRK